MQWYSWVIVVLSITNVYVLYKAILLQNALSQSLLDNSVAIAMLQTMKEELETANEFKDESNESFIKFLSDSREWAFKYIENTIETVNNIIKDCREEMNKPRIADLNTPAFLASIIRKLLPIVEGNKKDG